MLAEQFKIVVLCRVLKCSKSAYYAWRAGKTRRRTTHRRRLTTMVSTIYYGAKRRYGSPRIYRDIKAANVPCSRSSIVTIMQQLGLRAYHKRKFRITTDSDHDLPVAENLLNRDFSAKTINKKWVCDITYIRTREGWLYLAVVIDLFSRRVVGWSMKSHMKTELVLDALKMAISTRRPLEGLIHHSDRGVQYASHAYQNALNKAQMSCSMSRKGNCWDNAVAESFFSSLKRELVHPNGVFDNIMQARSEIFAYIETWYNKVRRHSSLGYVSPAEFEFNNQNVSLKNVA
ncbi:IS3 family transposase [Chitinophaga sp.]|uniref:IS3 family transposase n=1 Tax=Chitinophaga sp. TaxID=1869181 RepID=UPI0039C8B537